MRTLFEVEPDPEATLPDLRPLQGTDRQIPWAEDIRSKKLGECRKHLREHRLLMERQTEPGRRGRLQAGYARHLAMMARLEREVSARFWIDRRDNLASELLSGAEARPGNTYGMRD